MLHPLAIGWDWIGINLFDGSALTAFQVRDKNGLALWDGGSFRKGSDLRSFERHEARFTPRRFWQSPRSQTRYPVEWSVRTPLETFHVVALVDDQELDSRTSTGAIYWEGLCEVRTIGSKVLGRGYLEMTGYASALRL
jgi:predicted secreted hydrolase